MTSEWFWINQCYFILKGCCVICSAHKRTFMLVTENVLHHFFRNNLKESYFKDRRSP